MDPDTCLSKAVYVGMCKELGTPTQVRTRREVIDINEEVIKSMWILGGFERMMSGSFREGFRLKTSDMDLMLWLYNHKLICELSQASLYRTPQHTVILMEFEDLQPGFTRLKLLTPTSLEIVELTCIKINNENYVSSSLFRTYFRMFFQCQNGLCASSIQHGPCSTYTFLGKETDYAFCLRSHHWPYLALPWIQRCQQKQWPPEHVLSEIITEGCHVVPISNSASNSETCSEWRISFSGAEYKLVRSMNHCQFLCYGLLKIFLKEVINSGNEDTCLCSYFMKTVVFWVIQSSNLDWIPCNLLSCFWTCFKRLISWVYDGKCPNFFIPQNNMFIGKIVGRRQTVLFEFLNDLYRKGIACLSLSPTIGKYIQEAHLNSTLTISIDESRIISDVLLDFCPFLELSQTFRMFVKNKNEFAVTVLKLEQLQMARLTSCERVSVQYFLSTLLRNFSWMMSNQNMAILSNRKRKHIYDMSLYMLKLAEQIGCTSEILYLALYYYKNCQFELSLVCLQKAQERISKPYAVYNVPPNEEIYRCAVAGLSLSDKMRKCFVCDIELHEDYVNINELLPEQKVNKADGAGFFNIPPFVMLYMLIFLNHHRLGDRLRSRETLMKLFELLYSDNGTYIPLNLRDISWHVLGVCLQTCGEHICSLVVFQISLRQIPFHSIQKVTILRILLSLYRIRVFPRQTLMDSLEVNLYTMCKE